MLWGAPGSSALVPVVLHRRRPYVEVFLREEDMLGSFFQSYVFVHSARQTLASKRGLAARFGSVSSGFSLSGSSLPSPFFSSLLFSLAAGTGASFCLSLLTT